jgi:hypothetical protein
MTHQDAEKDSTVTSSKPSVEAREAPAERLDAARFNDAFTEDEKKAAARLSRKVRSKLQAPKMA